ncbi:hypothetical protein FRC10_005775, partial [Ceratobasidium sp. 414]
LKEDLVRIGYKILDIVISRRQNEKAVLDRKIALKTKGDVEMADATAGPSKETINALVKAEVKRAMKEIPKKKGQASGAGSSSAPAKHPNKGKQPASKPSGPRKPSSGVPPVAGKKRGNSGQSKNGPNKKSKKS